MELLSNADLYDPEPRGRSHLLVAGETIVWIGREVPAFPPNLGVVERDLEGRRVIPGLIDGHIHLTGGGGEAGPDTRVPPLVLSRLTMGGVTTAIGVLGTDDTVRSTAELVTTARGLIAEGLSAYCHTGGYHVPPATVTGSVRRDIVLIDLVLGVGELAISDHRSSQPTLDELLRIAGDAHVGGLMSGKAGIVHLHVGDGARGLELVRQALAGSELPPRVFNPTHTNRRKALFQEAMALARQGCTIDLTAFPIEEGDDGWNTLKELLDCGQPLERVLPAFTANPARLLRLRRKGHLTDGADADLVVLDDDAAVEDVMARGRWHVLGGRPIVRGAFEGRE
jgi:beta-aspartyl-dipeptidase (metallo-type)